MMAAQVGDQDENEHVLTIREGYLDSARESPYHVVTLTDEEIVAVDGPESVAPRFWYDALPPASREVAVAAASRGLVARGWAAANPVAESVADLALEPAGPLLAILGLRRSARLIVLAEQKLEAETRARVYYLLAAGMALEEAVNSGGLHRFTTMSTATAIAELTAWCDPFETPRPATPRVLTVDADADLAALGAGALGDTRVVTVVAAVSGRTARPVERYLTVYGSPDRLVLAAREGSQMRLRDIGRPDLGERLAMMVE